MSFRRAALALAGLAALAPAQEPAQQPARPPAAFEVASVKAAATPTREPMICLLPCSPGERLTVEGSRVDIRYMSLQKLIVTAYRIKPYQLSGPDWMSATRFDIAAKISAGVGADRLPEMLQALLAERFKLTIHRDNNDLPVYALVLGKNGSKLQPAKAEAAAAPLPETAGSRPLYTPQGDARMLPGGSAVTKSELLGTIHSGPGPHGGVQFEFLNLTMPGLAELLGPHMDRPVVDRTGISGGYYFLLEDRMPGGEGGRKGSGDSGRAGGDVPDTEKPRDVFAEKLFAVVERAGLKLEKSKAPVETIVVERLEKTPTAN
jgi:uncharacterized protein (TIGR03435 family)